MNSDREARRAALAAAKERLAWRKKQKEQLQLLREQKKSGGLEKNDYGKKLVQDTKQLLNEWSSSKDKQEEKIKETENDEKSMSKQNQIVPGPTSDLNIVHGINTIDMMHRSRVEYVKEIQTDCVEIAQFGGLIDDKTQITEMNEIFATFIEEDLAPWPNKRELIYDRIKEHEAKQKAADDQEEDIKAQMDAEEDAKQLEDDELKEELLVLPDEEALQLLNEPSFKGAFLRKVDFLEKQLKVNEEHSVFIEAQTTIRDISEKEQMEKLILSATIPGNERPITSLDFDSITGDRFLASYAGLQFSGMNASSRTHSAHGLINVYDSNENKLMNALECQSMICCAQFHPTKINMVIGASVSGQVLGWDMRAKNTPIIRTEFSTSSHTQPIFALDFLPSNSYMPSSKIQQILTLSNDAKLCVWRDDILHEPYNEFNLKLSKNVSSNQGGKEITSTCFGYGKNFGPENNRLWFGSDEGSIYCSQLDLNNDKKELWISQSIPDAHFGPITNIDFHPFNKMEQQRGLFLTSSFDWTIKLWHASSELNGSTRCITVFSSMQDYVYDVKWSPTKPSIFAAGDGSGNLSIFDLNTSFEHPASEPTNIGKDISITKILWAPNGKQVLVGDSDGKVSIYDCPVYDTTDADFDKLEAVIKRKLDSADR